MKGYNTIITKENIWVGINYLKTVFLLLKEAIKAKQVSRETANEFGSDDGPSGSKTW